MALVELKMPALGEGIIEATVLKWLKQVGEPIQEEDILLEIATDKVDSEVPSTSTGIIKELLFSENQIAPVGATIAIIETKEDKTDSADTKSTLDLKTATDQIDQHSSDLDANDIPYLPANGINSSANSAPVKTLDQLKDANNGANNGFFSPLVMSIAQKEGIPISELSLINGTGNDGRVSKNDILQYMKIRKNSPDKPSSLGKSPVEENEIQQIGVKNSASDQLNNAIPTSSFGSNVEIVEMDRMRKLIAHHMKDSQNVSATVTSFAEVDVTNVVKWREKIKVAFEHREQTKITFTPIFIECIARVIKRFPYINSSIDGDKIILKKDINIGMATALPSGNLIVPVIKKADHLNLVGLTKAVNQTALNARNNNLKPSDTQEGTFTITNVGSFGSITGTPIINQPQVAILAIGTIKKRPVVIETPLGDSIGIRHMMILSLSYDHRIIDGAMGSTFLNEVVKEIEAWDLKRSF